MKQVLHQNSNKLGPILRLTTAGKARLIAIPKALKDWEELIFLNSERMILTSVLQHESLHRFVFDLRKENSDFGIFKEINQ